MAGSEPPPGQGSRMLRFPYRAARHRGQVRRRRSWGEWQRAHGHSTLGAMTGQRHGPQTKGTHHG